MNHDDDSDLKTLFKYRVPSAKVRVVRDLLILCLLLLAFASGFVALGLVQYYFVCSVKDPNVTMLQCIRGEYRKR